MEIPDVKLRSFGIDRQKTWMQTRASANPFFTVSVLKILPIRDILLGQPGSSELIFLSRCPEIKFGQSNFCVKAAVSLICAPISRVKIGYSTILFWTFPKADHVVIIRTKNENIKRKIMRIEKLQILRRASFLVLHLDVSPMVPMRSWYYPVV